ncbi:MULTISPECIES: LysE family translocator [unclassified Herbaspirillum]|uniref:LysE family translocator n=1 Tax=unclassified Herbaspirillum TaxID=2624150 RepID=UPI00114DE2E1|nr:MULTISPECIES: LysE family translocator [unclassified Herbaspirillum]MBB5390853.1 threonine/homoserine/homoserine lactone efflux protein [Herbaspirillum sp. SJZ102]TQK06379.1 threonine/homoserine/homoserine lactone efflux protein [Herbaspirillum sp. SJZ130]TQK12143.1 threonine/homoserine/homoserine lactone efflux protein [Herbaspirillum sp. SJZ106]TWC64530.1 threonine/homoserine/homoserine lactone efflux protein [Herbaspirillum sp. SJZ099]
MDMFLPLMSFAFVSSITPGPNNIMLTSSGIWFGFQRSVPHMLGITFGFGGLLALCAFGIGALVIAVPGLTFILKLLGSAYLLYLAWQLRNMRAAGGAGTAVRPMSFWGAAAFQFANPKAWVMAITGASAFMPMLHNYPVGLAILLYCLIFCAINLPCISVWAAAGAVLRRYLDQPLWRTVFAATMVLLTLYSALAIWF